MYNLSISKFKFKYNLTSFLQLWFVIDYFHYFAVCTADNHVQCGQIKYWTLHIFLWFMIILVTMKESVRESNSISCFTKKLSVYHNSTTIYCHTIIDDGVYWGIYGFTLICKKKSSSFYLIEQKHLFSLQCQFSIKHTNIDYLIFN